MTLQFPWPSAPPPGEWQAVADGVKWLCLPLPFALDHVNVWLLESSDGVYVIDAGIKSADSEQIWSSVLNKLPAPIAGLVITHYHPDHAGMSAWLLDRCPAPVWFSQQDFQFCQRAFDLDDQTFADAQDRWFERHGLDQHRRRVMHRSGNTYRPFVHDIPANPKYIKQGDKFYVGAVDWKVITVGGHAPEMICLYSDKLNVLVAADQLLPSISPNVSVHHYTQDPDPLATFLDSLELFTNLPADVLVLPSHGLPYRGIELRIGELRQHHEKRLMDILHACDKPATAAEMLPVLFPRSLDYQQLMFAMGESIAHLRHLEICGELNLVSRSNQDCFVRNSGC